MNHLSLVRTQQDLQRAGEMIKGLNKFVDGKNGSQEFWNGSLAGQEKIRPILHKSGTARTISVTSTSPREPPQLAISPFALQSSKVSSPREDSSVTSSCSKPTAEHSLHPRERRLSLDGSSNGEPESLASVETKLLFSRASNLLREALNLDGMVFIDACFREISVVDPMSSNSSVSSPEYRFRGSESTILLQPNVSSVSSRRAIASPSGFHFQAF